MNAQTEPLTLAGAAGAIEALKDSAVLAGNAGVALGAAIIAHPHPLFAGTMNNKVVQTLARALVATGWDAYRFNFRGVGQSQGVHDNGIGEAEDLLRVIDQVAPEGPLVLAGFSFGTYVTSRVLAQLHAQRDIRAVVFIGTAASRFKVEPIPQALHSCALAVHGELDETVPIAPVMDWAREQSLPLTVIPGGEHFFHGRQVQLKDLVVRHLRGVQASVQTP
ncbi:alpha/beta fold hydrolase [Lampropedia puyangensis]|uniref:Alpha/beta fold hydrolase n=1 Tax=Lampropedia puyangensis TaxID=1330072 RepID=A0A4S8EXP4_9BURK|nr:alpha/beta fold hydrolase [Lampropedia puyangensis]THT97461.1 alpha/beta fold hydrolase [Lampropedia puyangensis]